MKKDVINKHTGESWIYTPEVKEHFFKPKNLLLDPPAGGSKSANKYDGVGLVGSPACGDVMRVWLKIDKKNDKIKEMKWRTFGCASAIASTSALSVMVTESQGRRGNGKGMKIDDALKIRPQDIIKRLGGLPDRKIHCSVLGDKALRAALNDWFKKSGQLDRIVADGEKIIDPDTKTTERDIEEAVLEGATDLAAVQRRTKVAVSRHDLIPQVEELIRFYREKYFGPDSR